MKQLVFDPGRSGSRMRIACFVSGSGTNYREIVKRNPTHHYLVFSNRPDCAGVALARQNGHEVVVLDQQPYLTPATARYGKGKVPRNCPERTAYEQETSRLIETNLGQKPDLVCLAGYDQWVSDWMVDRYFPRMLNVHPGDTTRGYFGLHWVPSARAILAGERSVRSTLFFVDKGEDTGPVFIQSAPLEIAETAWKRDMEGGSELRQDLTRVVAFAAENRIKTYQEFREKADREVFQLMAGICTELQDALKVNGDWQIYPLGVAMIAEGRVAVEGKTVYIDGRAMPPYGYRLEARG